MASVTPEPWSSHPHPRWASWGRQSAGPQGVGAQAPMASHVSPGARPWGLRADGWASGRARRGRWVLSGLNVRAGWPGAPVGGWAPARHGDGDRQAQGRCVFEMGVLRVDEDTVMVMAEGRDRGQKEEKPRAVGCGGGGEGWRLRADGAARLGVVWGLGSRELKGPHRQAFPPAAGGGLDGSDGRGEGSATHATGQRSPKGPVSPACPPLPGVRGWGPASPLGRSQSQRAGPPGSAAGGRHGLCLALGGAGQPGLDGRLLEASRALAPHHPRQDAAPRRHRCLRGGRGAPSGLPNSPGTFPLRSGGFPRTSRLGSPARAGRAPR